MNQFRRVGIRRLGVVLAVLVVGAIAGGPPALAAASAPARSPSAAAPAYLRLAQLSPDTPAMDVYVASVADPTAIFTVMGAGYGSVSDYQTLPASTYTVSMRVAGSPADSPPVIATVFTAYPEAAYTLAGLGYYAELGLTVLDDDLAMPVAGHARLRVINAAATAAKVDLDLAEGPALAMGVGFAESTGYRSVPAGSWTVLAGTAGDMREQLPIRVRSGAVYTVLLVDRDGELVAELYTDSVGSQTTPIGSVNTGYGGAAGQSTTPGPWLIGVIAASVVLVMYLARRGPARRGPSRRGVA